MVVVAAAAAVLRVHVTVAAATGLVLIVVVAVVVKGSPALSQLRIRRRFIFDEIFAHQGTTGVEVFGACLMEYEIICIFFVQLLAMCTTY